MTRPAALALGALLATAGCAREARDGGGVSWVGHIGPETLEGRVRVVGNEPFAHAVVEPDEGAGTIVTGSYQGEIRRLAGARIRVTGRRVEGQLPEATLDASSYEILSVDGDRPLLGRLERDDEGFYLERQDGSMSRLGFVSETLAAQAGALVWVVLDDRNGVARYGLLRGAS